MTCTTCRPGKPDVPMGDAIRLYHYRMRAGHFRNPCPECGLWRLPWEYPPPVWEATGLRWEWSQTCREWRLKRGDRCLGIVFTSLVRRMSYRATYPLVAGGARGHRTLRKACRALVEAVRRA